MIQHPTDSAICSYYSVACRSPTVIISSILIFLKSVIAVKPAFVEKIYKWQINFRSFDHLKFSKRSDDTVYKCSCENHYFGILYVLHKCSCDFANILKLFFFERERERERERYPNIKRKLFFLIAVGNFTYLIFSIWKTLVTLWQITVINHTQKGMGNCIRK